jgi:hypothetical protein
MDNPIEVAKAKAKGRGETNCGGYAAKPIDVKKPIEVVTRLSQLRRLKPNDVTKPIEVA